jgi:polysaccharide pyruvyl transferase WcaK-like protein
VVNADIIGQAAVSAGLKPRFCVFGSRDTLSYYDCIEFEAEFVNVGYRALISPNSELRRLIREMDLFFEIGGGDSFSDQYGWWRFGKIVTSDLLATFTGKPLVLSPQTIGPFRTGRARMAAKAVLGRAERVFARDEISMSNLSALGFAEKSHLVSDVAFLLPYTPKRTAAKSNGKLRIGLNVSGLLAAPDYNKLSVDYLSLMKKIIARLLLNPETEVVLVPHVLAPHMPEDDDRAASATLTAEFPRLMVAAPFKSPVQAKSFIAQLDLLIGSRMHATIAALSSGVPVLPLGYSDKFTGLFGGLNYPWLADLRTASETDVIDLLEEAIAKLDHIRERAAHARDEAVSRLDAYKMFLQKLFENHAKMHD